ncbi:hypothetical protein HHK36_022970 [Tetracentron sinense]|uniref:DUF3511 domain protein n=1 Tax=Tetracentron sinense TaxID=13715 RepID=A0A834YQH0_TETSI|nr:hypothetical protein HHK36_022970 [Tetracentron sinense]
MDDFRPAYRPYGGNRKLEIEIVNGKSFSANQIYSIRTRSSDPPPLPTPMTKVSKSSSSKSKKSWSFNDPEMKRRKRIAKYKVYTVEGKVKASFRKGFRWIKNKCSQDDFSFKRGGHANRDKDVGIHVIHRGCVWMSF